MGRTWEDSSLIWETGAVESCLRSEATFLKNIDHRIVLTGPEFEGTFFRPEAMALVERRLPEALRDAARMRVFASSRKIGRPGRIVETALDLWFGDVREDPESGGTAITARVPTLGDAAPQIFDQGVLWDDGLRKEDTVFDLLGDVVNDVRRQNRDSNRYDQALLRRLRRVLPEGTDTVQFVSPRYHERPVLVDEDLTEAADRLAAETPPDVRTRVVGKLEAMFFDSRAFRLVLDNGVRFRGLWVPDDPEPLHTLWGKRVLLEGRVKFKPTGAPLGIEAEAIRPAVERDALWAAVPQPRLVSSPPSPIALSAERNPLAAIWGLLADEGSDEQFLQELEAMS